MKCHVVKDLLPNYIDNLNNEETNAEIKKHLDECADCRADYDKMAATMDIRTKNKDVNFLKKLKTKILRRSIIAAVSACLILLTVLIIFAKSYQIPIPFDPRRMSVELAQMAVIRNEDGSTFWFDYDLINPPPGVYFHSQNDISAEYEYVRDSLRITWQSFSRISTQMIGRDVIRNGEKVRVVFYRHTKSPWDSLFFDYDLTDWQESGWTSGTSIYGDRYQSAGREPQMIEIYYLPVRNLTGLHYLSDEDFDAKRLNAWLVWKGIN